MQDDDDDDDADSSAATIGNDDDEDNHADDNNNNNNIYLSLIADTITTSTSIQKQLQIYYKLRWKVRRVAA